MMENVLREIQNETCIVYLDDIIVNWISLQEPTKRLKGVFIRIRKSKSKNSTWNCDFLKKVKYLGYIITLEGVKPNPNNVKLIVD